MLYQGTVAKVVASGGELHQQNLKQKIERQIEKLDLAKWSEFGFQGKFIGIDGINQRYHIKYTSGGSIQIT